MIFPTKYKCLNKNKFSKGLYSIVPIRFQDRMDIMKWRNEQIYHLRQSEPLTEEGQNQYFENVVAKLFEQERPNQILFSYLQEDKCIGYGGLVHINWIDKNAEISFIIDTVLEKEEFELHWLTYLSLLEEVAFEELWFHKIFTFAFDLRPHLYKIVQKAGFFKEAQLKDHYYWEGKYIDAIIHSKLNYNLQFRLANIDDLELYYEWTNDENVRLQSFNSKKINIHSHSEWFCNKLKDPNCFLYICENQFKNPLGQIRIEIQGNENRAIIGVSLDIKYRGQGLSSKLLKGAIKEFKILKPHCIIEAYIKNSNLASINSFVSAGFKFVNNVVINNIESSLYTL